MQKIYDYLMGKYDLANYATLKEDLIYFLVSIILAFLVYFFIKFVIFKQIEKVIKKSSTKVDDILLKHGVIKSALLLVPIFIIYLLVKDVPVLSVFVNKLIYIVIILQLLKILFKVGSSLEDMLSKQEGVKNRNVKLFSQIFKIVVVVLGGLLIGTVLLESSILKILSGVVVLIAVAMVVFKETILLSFTASLHISMNNLIDIGDWIVLPSCGVDGDVIDISFNNVTVQNFDKSIVSVPKVKFLDNSFVNWKGMQQAGARRIKRSILIDHTTIKFCDEELLEKLQKIDILSSFLKNRLAEIEGHNSQITSEEFINKRALTNIGVFRFYIEHYLKKHHGINEKLTLIVRQLEPTEKGLPIQIYCFANTAVWAVCESIQSDIFDHIFSVLHYFDLRVFQLPSGNDFRRK